MSSNDIEVVRAIARDEIAKKLGIENESNQSGDKHAETDAALREMGINNYTCSNCGPRNTGSGWKESDYHECTGPDCDANRVLNGLKRCPFCGEDQDGVEGR